jgi:hypothetical protein
MIVTFTHQSVSFYYDHNPMTVRIDEAMVEPLTKFCDAIAKLGYVKVDSLGIYNRRKIAGTDKWSAHAWRKAVDIVGVWMISGKKGLKYKDTAQRNKLVRLLREAGFTSVNHTTGYDNHLHVNMPYDPTKTPPITL